VTGTIVKRGDSYAVVLSVGRDAAGKRVRHWRSGYRTRRDAELARIELLGKLRDGTYADPSRTRARARGEAVRLLMEGKAASITLPDGPFRLLYRCWGEDQRLLYVGLTENGRQRVLKQHAPKGWFERECIAVTFERVPAVQAVDLEHAAIAHERPAYNRQP